MNQVSFIKPAPARDRAYFERLARIEHAAGFLERAAIILRATNISTDDAHIMAVRQQAYDEAVKDMQEALGNG